MYYWILNTPSFMSLFFSILFFIFVSVSFWIVLNKINEINNLTELLRKYFLLFEPTD